MNDFPEALAAIDGGDVDRLEELLRANPELVRERFEFGDEAYFREPYLLWFIAENPVRNGRLPANIANVGRVLLQAGADQVDYALALVSSGRVPRECGVQRELMDVLLDAGADPNEAMTPALTHRERDAAEHLLARGARMTVVAAACTGRIDDLERLWSDASTDDRQMALSGAALHGDAEMLARIVALGGVDLDAFSPAGFHAHATALHHAIDAGSLEAVQVLVDAGARTDIRDRAFGGTALDWAQYLERTEIASFLSSRG